MRMIAVVAELVLDIQEDQNAGGHADGEPGDVDERVGGMPSEVAYGYTEVVLEHLCFSSLLVLRSSSFCLFIFGSVP